MKKEEALRSIIVTLVLVGCVGCSSTNTTLKASPAKPTAFLEHADEMKEVRGRAPFNRVWRNPEVPSLTVMRERYDSILIRPVTLAYLGQGEKEDIRDAVRRGTTKESAEDIAAFMQEEFIRAAKERKALGLRVVNTPSPNTIIIELALTEIKPTQIAENVVGTVGGAFVPGAGTAMKVVSKGSVAFEAKLRSGDNQLLLGEAADRESDPMTIISMRDYERYGHAKSAISDWANQLIELMSTPPSHTVADSSTLDWRPW